MKSLVQIKAALQAEFQKFPEMDERGRVINAAMMLLKALQNRKNDLRSIENEEFFEGICLDPQNSLGKNGKHAQNLRHNFGETQYHLGQIVNAQNAVFWNVLRSPIHGSDVAKEIIHLIQEYVDALNITNEDFLTSEASPKPVCMISNERNSYVMNVDGENVIFNGSSSADYLAAKYASIGYEVKRYKSLEEIDLFDTDSKIKGKPCLALLSNGRGIEGVINDVRGFEVHIFHTQVYNQEGVLNLRIDEEMSVCHYEKVKVLL